MRLEDLLNAQLSQAAELFGQNRPEEARATLEAAGRLAPGDVSVLCALGNVAGQADDFHEALKWFERAGAMDGASAPVRYYQGLALQKLQRHEEALAAFDRALALFPDFFEALNDSANSLRALGRPEQGLPRLDRAAALRPDSFQVYFNRGLVLGDLKRHEEEAQDYDRTLALNPGFVDAWVNSAAAFASLGNFSQALSRIQRALAAEPAYAEGLFIRAGIEYNIKDYKGSAADFETVIGHGPRHPRHAEALSGLAHVHAATKRHDLACRTLEQLRAVAPDYPQVTGRLLANQMMCSEWASFDADIEAIKRQMAQGLPGIPPFPLLGLLDDPALHLQAAQALVSEEYPPKPRPLADGIAYRHDRIRLAYVSADFHEHATAMLMAGVFEAHDRSRFELIGISLGPDDSSALRERVKRGFSQFIDVPLKADREVAELIRSLEVDIAVDLKGFTTDTRFGVFAHRPAPVQVSYLGYPGTTGAPYIDYVIADPQVLPEALRPHFSEQAVWLPHSYQCNDDQRAIADQQVTRADAGLPADAFVFASFNNSFKLTPPTFDGWMRILHAVPDSVLWLLGSSTLQQENLHREAQARGIDPSRLVFARRLPPAEHLRRLQLADLYLDNLPYNAHTSASDALWAGLPVVTCTGTAFAGRVATSLLTAIGLPELVCAGQPAYEQRAVELALERGELMALRQRLGSNRHTHPLFDTERFTRYLEEAYAHMVRLHEDGLPPAAFRLDEAGMPSRL